VIDRLPKCLHTCLHCRHAVILESYTGVSKRLIFDGCWKTDSIELPLAREECDKFEESPDRVKRKYWEKWNWKVYVDKDLVEQIRPEEGPDDEEGPDEVHDQSSEQEPGEMHGQLHEQGPGGSEQLTQGSQTSCEQPIVHIRDLPQGPGISLKGNAHSAGSGHNQREGKENGEADFVPASELVKEGNTKEEKEKPEETHKQPNKQRANPPTRELILQALSSNISRLKDIADFASVNPSTAHYHLSKLIRSGQVERSSYGTYILVDSTSNLCEQDLKTFEESGHTSSQRFELLKTSEGKLLRIIVEETLNGNPNITNKLLSNILGLSKSYVNRVCVKLEEKGLIKRKNLGMFIHNEATIHAVKLFTTPSALHAVEVTPCEQDLKSSKTLEVRPNNIRFKVQVLEGNPAPHWKEVPMRSWIARWCHDYECPVQFTPSHAVIYIPAFNTENLFFSFYEAYKRAKAVLLALEHDHNYKFGRIEMIAAHNAIINDPLALLAEFEGVIQDKDKRLQLDRSCGFKELEAIQTHLCEEDVIKILNLIYNPVIKGEYNPWELLKGSIKGIR